MKINIIKSEFYKILQNCVNIFIQHKYLNPVFQLKIFRIINDLKNIYLDDEYNSFKLTCSNEYDSLSKIINIDYITDFSIINSAPVVVLDRSGYNIKSEDDVVFLNKSNQKICLDSFDVDVYKNFPDDYEYSLYLKNDSNEILKKNNPCLGSSCTISFENLDIEV